MSYPTPNSYHKWLPLRHCYRTVSFATIWLALILLLSACGNAKEDLSMTEDSAIDDSAILNSCRATKTADSTPPSPWESLKVFRHLSDSEIDDLDFSQLKFSDNGMKFIFDDWRSFAAEHRPFYSVETCPKCGRHLLVIYSETPDEYWHSLSGRGGDFFICTNCQCEWRFLTTIEN